MTVDGKQFYGTSTGSAKLLEIIDGKVVFQEATDQVPDAIRKANKRLQYE